MKFKKSLLTIAALSVFSGSALALEKGDPMPDLTERGVTMSLFTFNKAINYFLYPGSKEGSENWEYAEAISINPGCTYTIKPFAIQSFKEMEIYMDLNRDGEIDYVFRKNIKKDSIQKIGHSCSN